MEHKDVCFEIENDEFYRQFLIPCVKQTRKVSNASEKIEKLTKGIQKLNTELEIQVLSKHQDLLTQAAHATNLENVVGSMQFEAEGLLSGIEKLRSQMLVPYNILENQTTMLGRIQKICHIMRQASKIIDLYKELQQLDNSPTLQASLIYEVEQIIMNGDFEGIEFLSSELQNIKIIKSRIVETASQQVGIGLATENKKVLISSFNIFDNLHCVKEKIDEIVVLELDIINQNIQSILNLNSYNEMKKTDNVRVGPGKANVINTQFAKQCFWENLEKFFNETLYISCKKIILLQNSLNDLHSFENFRNVSRSFWDKLSNTFSSELKKSSHIINSCIEVDFPRLLNCYNKLCIKLHCKLFFIKRDMLSVWENGFLSKSLGKLLEPVRTMWQLNRTPTTEQVDEVVRIISSTLSASFGDKQLGIALATNVAKCIKQMSTEAEQRVYVDSDAGQVVEAPTSSQQKNADLSNILYYFSKQINRVLSNLITLLSSESINIIQEALKDVSSVSVMQPFCISINSAVVLILGSMHSEIELKTEITGNVTYSLYMRELQQFLTKCRDMYLSLYEDTYAVNKCCDEIALYCIEIFMYNVCSLRPISDHGRKKLKLDGKELVIILRTITTIINHPIPFRQLRTLLRFLESSPIEILDYHIKEPSIPNSLVMMLLFSFAGPYLKSPHQCAGWSQHQLVSWLCEHRNEKKRIEFITGALQRYENVINQYNITVYDDVYLILLQLLEYSRKQHV